MPTRIEQLLDWLDGKGQEGDPEALVAGERQNGQNFKTEGGVRFQRSDYAIRGEAGAPTTWKLRLAEGSSGNFTVAQVARAITAMQSGGFRGQRVQLKSGEKAEAVRNISRAISKVGDADQKKNLRSRLAGVKAWELLEDAIEDKALSLGDIRGAVSRAVDPPSMPVVEESHAWVKDVFPDGNTGHAIVRKGDRHFRIPYTIQADDSLELGEAEVVEQVYQPVGAAQQKELPSYDLAEGVASGIKVVEGADGKDYWVAITSNAFKDLEGEAFATEALKEYVAQVDEGIPDGVKDHLDGLGLPATDQGELWLWHMPGTRIGRPLWKGIEGRMLLEVGEFDDTPLAEKAKEEFRANGADYRVSHGYLYRPADKAERVYRWMWKFETSALPAAHAANPWTAIGVIAEEAKSMDEEKVAWLKETFGAEEAERLVTAVAGQSKTLEEKGVDFKEGEGAPAAVVAEPDPAAGATTTEEDEDGEKPVPVLHKDSEAFGILVKGVAEAVAAEMELDDLRTSLESLAAQVKAIQDADQPLLTLGRGYRASQASETIVEVEGEKGVPAVTTGGDVHPLDRLNLQAAPGGTP